MPPNIMENKILVYGDAPVSLRPFGVLPSIVSARRLGHIT
jgi:hypothetical protein